MGTNSDAFKTEGVVSLCGERLRLGARPQLRSRWERARPRRPRAAATDLGRGRGEAEQSGAHVAPTARPRFLPSYSEFPEGF